MRDDVERGLQKAIEFRRAVLRDISHEQRTDLLGELLRDFFVQQRASLLKWSALTGQSAQVDTGSIAQHVASLVLREPGQGFKGKGLDLADGSEVKSAAILSGVDRPRWNHNMGTPADDLKRQERGQPPVSESYFRAPTIFYFLFDRVVDAPEDEIILRVRGWCVNPTEDGAWRDLIHRFLADRAETQYNLQLHPPVGYDDDIVVNTLGNLDMSQVKVLDARLTGWRPGEEFAIHWEMEPPETMPSVSEQCRSLDYGGRQARPSRLMAAQDVDVDIEAIQVLLPGIDVARLREALEAEAEIEDADPGDDSQV